MATLIGSGDKWTYISKDGTKDNFGIHGISIPKKIEFSGKNIKEIMAILNKDRKAAPYEEGLLIKSDADKDKVMIAAAEESANETYDLGTKNCADVPSDALEAGGFDPGNESLPLTSDSWSTANNVRNPIPNLRFKSIEKNNKGTHLSFDQNENNKKKNNKKNHKN